MYKINDREVIGASVNFDKLTRKNPLLVDLHDKARKRHASTEEIRQIDSPLSSISSK